MMSLAPLDDLSSVATCVQHCLDSFHNACISIAKAEPGIRNKLPPGTIHDCLGSFRLWVGNMGAHRRGRASLDYKLREASHIRERVLELLQNLESVLLEAIEIITGERVPWEDFSDSDSDVSDNESDPSEGKLTTELAQLVSNMAEINSCLMRLSLAIRNPAPHDQFKESTRIDIGHFEAFDIEHVRGKFPAAEEYLVIRLGKAISRRRQYLRYREEHRKRLEQGLATQSFSQEPVTTRNISHTVPPLSEKLDSTVASSIPLAVKVSALTTNLDEHDYYEDTLSQTSYASSNTDICRLRPLPLPDEGQDGNPFECPLCFRITSVRHITAWHKHVYRDLQPYVCTFNECEISDRIYESRHEWFLHELQAHRKWWECVEECNKNFRSLAEFHNHLSQEHDELSDNNKMCDIVRNCERQDSMETEAKCQLCRAKLSSLTQLRHHLGKHHEELSLFALPSHMKEDDDEDDGDEVNGSESEKASSDQSGSHVPVVCEKCGLNFSDNHENKHDALAQHLEKIHGHFINDISSLDEIDPRFINARDLLQKKPAIVEAMDELMFDSTLLHPRLRLHMPADVNTWAELKQWLTTKTSGFSIIPYPKQIQLLQVLQAVQFKTTMVTQEVDDYFERLIKFHADKGVYDIGNLEFTVDSRPTTLYHILKAIESHGGFSTLNGQNNWTKLGLGLGHSTQLTLSGAETIKEIYDLYINPFEEQDAASTRQETTIDLKILSHSPETQATIELARLPLSTTLEGLCNLLFDAIPSKPSVERMCLTYDGTELVSPTATLTDILGAKSALQSADHSLHLFIQDQDFRVVQQDLRSLWLTEAVSLYADNPTIQIPRPGKVELSRDGWLYRHHGADGTGRILDIAYRRLTALGVLRVKHIMLDGTLYELHGITPKLVYHGKLYIEFEGTDDFIAAFEHAKREVPGKLRRLDMLHAEALILQDLLGSQYTTHFTTGTNYVENEGHDVIVTGPYPMQTMLAVMTCSPSGIRFANQKNQDHWVISGDSVTMYKIGELIIEIKVAYITKRRRNRQFQGNSLAGPLTISLTPNKLTDVEMIGDMVKFYADHIWCASLSDNTHLGEAPSPSAQEGTEALRLMADENLHLAQKRSAQNARNKAIEFQDLSPEVPDVVEPIPDTLNTRGPELQSIANYSSAHISPENSPYLSPRLIEEQQGQALRQFQPDGFGWEQGMNNQSAQQGMSNYPDSETDESFELMNFNKKNLPFTVVGIPDLEPRSLVYASVEFDSLVLRSPSWPADQYWSIPDYGMEKLTILGRAISIKAIVLDGLLNQSLMTRDLTLTAPDEATAEIALSVLRTIQRPFLRSQGDQQQADVVDLTPSDVHSALPMSNEGVVALSNDLPLSKRNPMDQPEDSIIWTTQVVSPTWSNTEDPPSEPKETATVEYQDIRVFGFPLADQPDYQDIVITLNVEEEQLWFRPTETSRLRMRMAYTLMKTIKIAGRVLHITGNVETYYKGLNDKSSAHQVLEVSLEAQDEAQAEEIGQRLQKGSTSRILREGWDSRIGRPSDIIMNAAEGVADYLPSSASSSDRRQQDVHTGTSHDNRNPMTMSDEPILSRTVKAYVLCGGLDDIDFLLLTEAQFHVSTKFLELSGEKYMRWNYRCINWIELENAAMAIVTTGSTIFLQAASVTDAHSIVEGMQQVRPVLKPIPSFSGRQALVDAANETARQVQYEEAIGSGSSAETTHNEGEHVKEESGARPTNIMRGKCDEDRADEAENQGSHVDGKLIKTMDAKAVSKLPISDH